MPEPASSPLRRREFRLYFAGNLASNIGNWLANVALAIFMHDLTHSSFWVGLALFGLNTPVLFFGLKAGVLADRLDRVRLLIVSQVVMGTLATALTVLVAIGHAGRYNVTLISFGMGIGVALSIPAMQALIPVLVPHEELADAIRLNALTFNSARIFGPAIAAITLKTLGASWAFGLNALSFVPLLWALRAIGTPPFPRAADRPPGPISEGIAYAWTHLRTRSMLLAIVAISIALDPITTLSPALATRFGLRSNGAGWIVTAWGCGGVLVIVGARKLIIAATRHGTGWAGLLALAAGMVLLGATRSPVIGLTGGALAGVGYILATMVFTTVIQSEVPESLRGRVSAIWTLAFLGPRAVVSVLDGFLGDRFGAGRTTIAFGLVALVAAAFLRRVETSAAEPVPPPA
ncbi:MAG: MFS transporter [Actinomycetota bacterium]